jgi:hypothetical protein
MRGRWQLSAAYRRQFVSEANCQRKRIVRSALLCRPPNPIHYARRAPSDRLAALICR